MFERPSSGERAVLVRVCEPGSVDDSRGDELEELVRSAGAQPVGRVTSTRRTPDPRFFIGGGKAEHVRDVVADTDAQIVIVDHSLSPAQERNLERLVKCRVLDRIALILDIFAQRANTFEGKLQVELAQLKHLSTRLVRGWTHLERQRGGIGMRGPGEKQLESDRRLVNDRIRAIERKLEGVSQRRALSRRRRNKAEIPVVSLVGYTNAGKSTLFNALTAGTAYAADRLFATLDPTLRALEVKGAGPVILADTVGFIRELPHDLVAAFRATLEETREATLLLHVIDASAEDHIEKTQQVNEVLARIGASDVPQLEIYNKVDRLSETPEMCERYRIDRDEEGRARRVWVSAQAGEGLDLVREACAEILSSSMVRRTVRIAASNGRLRAKLFELGAVVQERVADNGDSVLDIAAARGAYERLCRDEGLNACETLLI